MRGALQPVGAAAVGYRKQEEIMKKRPPRQRVYGPKSEPKPKIPESLKQVVAARCNAFVDTVLKPERIHPPLDDTRFSYIVDLSTQWYHSFFYFCATYRCPAPECISEFFEVKFTRLEYSGGERFNLAYMRHTDKWQEVFQGLTLDECLKTIEEMPVFWP
jgi:hypothetical protein